MLRVRVAAPPAMNGNVLSPASSDTAVATIAPVGVRCQPSPVALFCSMSPAKQPTRYSLRGLSVIEIASISISESSAIYGDDSDRRGSWLLGTHGGGFN